MAFFEDLSVCSYFDFGQQPGSPGSLGLPPLVAVGWLERGHPYTTGHPGSDVVRRLIEFRSGRWNPAPFLGGQVCDLCPKGKWQGPRVEPGTFSRRNLFVPGSGVTFAAPEGIVHYVMRHDYHPPSEFCQALLAAPPVDSPEYFAALRALGWSNRFLDNGLKSPAT